MTPTVRLAAGQTPFLLEPEQRPMSRGTWENGKILVAYDGERYSVKSGKELVAIVYTEANATFIASLNGAEPIVDELWQIYLALTEVFKDYLEAQNFERAAEIKQLMNCLLRRLDGLKCLGWREGV